MEKQIASTQTEQYLDILLKYVACPIDNSVLLTAIRNPDGKVIALKSKDREYQVVNNIPRLIPELGESRGGGQAVWQKLQDAVWQDYQSGDEDVFSVEDDLLGRGVGQIIKHMGAGLFLDVGCGLLSLPVYMTDSNDSVSWLGLDPFFGNVARQFPFVQALAEYAPFQAHLFDGVLYAGTIEHMIEPLRSLERTRSIIKPQGKLFIWSHHRRVDSRYIIWKTMSDLGFTWLYNKNHQWAFNYKTLSTLLKKTGFAIEEMIPLCQKYCPDYPTCDDPSDFLAIAGCV